MHQRCKEKSPWKKWYFDRGINVCNEWKSYEQFRIWSLNNGFKETLELDRINNNSGYSPENCRWTSHKENCNNKSNNLNNR